MLFQKKETWTIAEFINRKDPQLKEEFTFFLQQCLKEVTNSTSKRQRKKYQSILLKTASVSLSVLMITTPAFAQTPQTSISEVDSVLKTIQLICLGLVASVATICLMIAGSMRMVGMGEKAKAWTIEIIKGALQVISAPVIIWLIITLTKGLLSPLPGFQNF